MLSISFIELSSSNVITIFSLNLLLCYNLVTKQHPCDLPFSGIVVNDPSSLFSFFADHN